MFRASLFILAIIIATGANAQNLIGTINGVVKDKSNHPLMACNILLQKKDSSAVKGTITDSTGAFKLDVPSGEYLVAVSMVGYENYKSKLMVVKENTTINLPAINIASATKNLTGVTVTAQKKLFEMLPDKMVMNIENSILATGNSVFDVLRKAPAVTTDKDDNIKLKGSISQIFIDGKPAYISGQQLIDYLKSLPADAVSKIEIITNPSSKYDAAGATGIINIKLKKNQAYGLNGTANVGGGYGKYGKINGGTNLNYRNNKVNIFGSGYIGNSESYNQLNYNSTIINNGAITYQDRDNYWHPHSTYASYKTGVDYSIGKNSTIGILYRGGFSSTDARTDNHSILSDANHQPQSLVTSIRNAVEKDHNNFFNLNYKTTLDTLGSELNVDADYAIYKKTGTDVNENHFMDAASKEVRVPYIFRNIQPANGSIKAFKADYTKFFKNKLKLETGFKVSDVKSDDELIADSLQNNNWQTDKSRTNHFIYNENIYAAYVTLSKTFHKTSIQAGLRAENTVSEGNSVTLDKVDKRNYLDFFPTLFISQELNKDNQLNFSYTKRISRPGYQSLNPFVMYLDPYTYFEGNPYLRPSYTNSFEIKHGFKQTLFTALSYGHATDIQTQVIRQNNATGITTNTSENANSSDYVRLDVSASLTITKWWSSDNNMGLAYSRDLSTIPDYNFDTRSFVAEFSSSNTFSLPNNYKLQTSFYYSIPTKDGIAQVRSSYGLDAGIQKQLWNNKATIKLNATNIIGPSAYRAHYVNDNLNILWQNKWEGRRLMVSFVYKFGSNTVKATRSRTTASQQEQNRIN